MNLDLRQAVLQRVQGKEASELHDILNDSVGGDEKALPGLGVLFELIWENCDKKVQDNLVKVLEKQLV